MQISAQRISIWAKQASAATELPRLVRRLIHATTKLQAVSVPAGENVFLSGWDGRTASEEGSTWVPRGLTCWEFSREKDSWGKASEDFDKRTAELPPEERAISSFVFVTPRSWGSTTEWAAEKSVGSGWSEVRAYNAATLEEWIEQAPAVALAFAEELGDSGPGVESPERFWLTWSTAVSPNITPQAFRVGRTQINDELTATISKRIGSGDSTPLSLRADTAEEAAAFASTVVMSSAELSARSLVVTAADGWRYVEKQPNVSVAIVGNTEIAKRVPSRAGLVLVVPYGASDVAVHQHGASQTTDTAEIKLDRPRRDEFTSALTDLGIEEAEADRLSKQVGRSWSILRRRRSSNPAIRAPEWLRCDAAWVLSTVCLAGSWDSDRSGDRDAVGRIAARPYEDIEKAMQVLSQLDDAPVLRIGTIWKAKAALELLDLFAARITNDELDRYFAECHRVFTEPDPALDLPSEDRGAAEIYNRRRPQSGLLLESLGEGLIKLAVRGSDMPGLRSLKVKSKVERVVGDLLSEADATRWLSLAGLLRPLAEAAPNQFLTSVEASLSKPDPPIAALFSESTQAFAFFSRSYHPDLLWSLEVLAWDPKRFVRVVRVLVGLMKLPIHDKLGNHPLQTFVGLFRTWLPQTAAPVKQRLEVLEWLAIHEPAVAFKILNGLVYSHHALGHHSVRPQWRSDDAGHGRGVSKEECEKSWWSAADHLIDLARGNGERLAHLIGKLEAFDQTRVDRILDLVAHPSTEAWGDEDRERLCDALRSRMNWHQQRRKCASDKLPSYHGRLRRMYEQLTPRDLVVRHRWLFRDGWPELLISRWKPGANDRTAEIEKARRSAVNDLVASEGMDGVIRLARGSLVAGYVGRALAEAHPELATSVESLLPRVEIAETGDHVSNLMLGILRGLQEPKGNKFLRELCSELMRRRNSTEKLAAVIALAPVQQPTWEFAAELGAEVDAAYWKVCNPEPWVREGDAHFEFVLRKLCSVGRAGAALAVSRFYFSKLDPELLIGMLEQFASTADADAGSLDPHDMREGIDRLEESPIIDRHRLALLEFRVFEGLGFEGGRHAASLYSEILSDPRVFAEFVCAVYPPHRRTDDSKPTEEEGRLASHMWRILNDCEAIPGMGVDGKIDGETLKHFVDEARRLCGDADRLGAFDSTIGEILAGAPSDVDGSWPPLPVCDVLDLPQRERMRVGFEIGAHNRRGMYSKAYAEGGDQERALSAKYRAHAELLHNSHPNVAVTLERIAEDYRMRGDDEDERAKMMIERG